MTIGSSPRVRGTYFLYLFKITFNFQRPHFYRFFYPKILTFLRPRNTLFLTALRQK